MTDLKGYKQKISEQVGVPIELLTGETLEENIALAKVCLALKREARTRQPKTVRENFKEWFDEVSGTENNDNKAYAILAEIEETARLEAGGYPFLNDKGEIKQSTTGTVKNQFEEWAGQQLAFDPFKH